MSQVTKMKCISILKDYRASSGEGGEGKLKSRETWRNDDDESGSGCGAAIRNDRGKQKVCFGIFTLICGIL